jgi:hypothetical protein
VGVPPTRNDLNLGKMTNLILSGKILEAAHLATEQDHFYDITLKNMVVPLSDRFSNPLAGLNDFVATWIGTVRDNKDIRELLTGNTIYVGSALATTNKQACASSTVYKSNTHYSQLTRNLKTDLVAVPQCSYNGNSADPQTNFTTDSPVLHRDPAGLLTTRTWAINHMVAGTNRRAVEKAFEVFLCKEINDLADNSTPDWHIRRDVGRSPAGDAAVYNASCRSCHGGMDALGGAFAFYDAYADQQNANDFRMFFVPTGGYGANAVMPKLNLNSAVFPPGYATADDSWENFWTQGRNESLGWSTEVPTKGNGLHALGLMLANTDAFASCMSKRVFTEVCKRPPGENETQAIDDLKNDLKANGYSMRRLFEKAASLSVCLGNRK